MIWDRSAYHYRNLGRADDFQDANGADVLSFAQAQRKAWDFSDEMTKGRGARSGPVTVNEAAERYMAWYRDHRRAVTETDHALRVHILPFLGTTKLSDLSAR